MKWMVCFKDENNRTDVRYFEQDGERAKAFAKSVNGFAYMGF
ncbi:hypothetical protein [Butyrivibrio proteoclasticus]|nr:hypothetical protein [Butyrivibrio proteoclasticus]